MARKWIFSGNSYNHGFIVSGIIKSTPCRIVCVTVSAEGIVRSGEDMVTLYPKIVVLARALHLYSVVTFREGIATLLQIFSVRERTTQKQKQWHSCEHKLIFLLRKGGEVTLETLRLASAINIRCGSNMWQKYHLAKPTDEQLLLTVEAAKKFRSLQRLQEKND